MIIIRRGIKKFIIILLFFALAGCINNRSTHVDEPPDGGDGAVMFKHEYEVLNGQTAPDGEHVYKEVLIPAGFPVLYADGEGAKELLSSGSGVLFMGFPECPWCRTLLPALVTAYEKSGFGGYIYYYNALEDRDALSLSDGGEILVESEGAPVYHDLVAILYDHLMPYDGLNDDSIRRIYLPTTVFVKNGEITSVHLTTIESQENGYDVLTDEQFTELVNLLFEQFNAIAE